MENQKTFYVCEFHNGKPQFIHYETRDYAELHVKCSPYKCRIYTSDQVHSMTDHEKTKFYQFFMPFHPSRMN